MWYRICAILSNIVVQCSSPLLILPWYHGANMGQFISLLKASLDRHARQIPKCIIWWEMIYVINRPQMKGFRRFHSLSPYFLDSAYIRTFMCQIWCFPPEMKIPVIFVTYPLHYNIWNVSCAQATAFNTRTNVLVKVSMFLMRQSSSIGCSHFSRILTKIM